MTYFTTATVAVIFAATMVLAFMLLTGAPAWGEVPIDVPAGTMHILGGGPAGAPG